MEQNETTAILSRSFGAVADEYDRLRPGPPPEALDWLVSEAANDAVELGAGTGVVTRLLAERVPRVTAVEPDDRMREVLAEGAGAGVEVVAGRAEQIPVASCSADVILASSAWHWVDERQAVPEVARVLRPGGRLSLVWSGPDRSLEWMRSLWSGGTELDGRQRPAVDQARRRRHAVDVGPRGLSPFLPPETHRFTWIRPMAKDDLVALAATYSAVITMEETTRRAHLDAMRRVLETQPRFLGCDVVDVPMRALCWRAVRQ